MNDRIKELAHQAGSTHKLSLGVYQFYQEELEKFGQLIIDECCSQINDRGLYSDGHRAKHLIRKHFGLEK
jgi:hypothetical protein